MENKELVNRLNRAIGQIDSVRKKLEKGEDDDCITTLRQLKASINALKKFGEAYMLQHLDTCMDKGKSSDDMQDNLKSVISGAFSL